MAVAGSALFLAVAAGRGVAVGAAAAGLAGRAAVLARAGRAACVAFSLLDALDVGGDFQIDVRVARCVVARRAGFAVGLARPAGSSQEATGISIFISF